MGFMNTFYSSHKSGRKRGVAILLPKKINFQLTAEIKDKEGRFILIRGKMDHKEVTLLNVYMPPGHDKSLFRKVFNLLIQTPLHQVLFRMMRYVISNKLKCSAGFQICRGSD